MDLSEVKQLTHKIKRINLKNENFYSAFEYITQKITLTDVDESEVVRFSLEENSNFIQHQSFNNDYYIIIPNNLNSITYIYVHYFPIDLYDYEEDENVSSQFDFTELLNINDEGYATSQRGYKYPVVKSGNGYVMEDNEGKLVVRSSLNNSIDGYKNPNYKEITKASNEEDETEQGKFPLSSRYRNKHQYFDNAPDLENEPQWNARTVNETICKQKPYWEVRINRDGLSRLISDKTDGEYDSISMNLNYQYLPTSTHYHQHYYGFEDECPSKDDLYVMESTHMNEVNENFNEDTYRIIKRTNPFDNSKTMHVDHECILPLELLSCTPKDYITKNRCYDYYIYTAIGNETPSIIKNLTEGEQYSLRYFIFVPDKLDTFVEEYNNDLPKLTKEIFEEPILVNIDDVVAYYHPELVEVSNGKLISHKEFSNLSHKRGNAYIKNGWHNSKHWTISFTIYTSNNAQYDGYVLIKSNVESITTSTELWNSLGFKSGGALDYFDDVGNKTTLTYSENYRWRGRELKVILERNGSNYQATYINNSNIYTYEFNYNGFDNYEGDLNLVLTTTDNFYASDISLYNINYIYNLETIDKDLIITSDCYLSVNGETIPNEFLVYDKTNRNKWIYHEVPFISQGGDLIEIVGPKNNPDIQFFLVNVEIEKFIPYSPTLTYNNTGLTVTENLDWDSLCKSQNKYTSGQVRKIPELATDANWTIKPATTVWEKHEILQNPKGKVFFTLNDDVEFYYDETTFNLIYSHLDTHTYKLQYYPKNYTDTDNISHNAEDLFQKNWNIENMNLSYDSDTGDVFATYPRNVIFYKGPNNSFQLYVSDEYSLPVTRGTVEVEFVKEPNLESKQLVYAGKKVLQQDGYVKFKNVDLSEIEVENELPTKYYLRIKYEDPCFEDEDIIYDFKMVWVELPTLKMVPKINGNYKNKRFIGYDKNKKLILADDCNQYRNSKYYADDFDNCITKTYTELANPPSKTGNNGEIIYQGQWNHYRILDKTPFKGLTDKIRGGYYIYDVEDEFPLNISAFIYNQTSTGNIGGLDKGYCELSVDDKVIQTTIVDDDGIADFYLDLEDVPLNKHTIKIEYYTQYWVSIKYFYFDLVICDENREINPITIEMI